MPATCVPQYVPRANTGLSKHGDPVFLHFWSWNQNLARVCARGGGGGVGFASAMRSGRGPVLGTANLISSSEIRPAKAVAECTRTELA